jgi:hypothetical protein
LSAQALRWLQRLRFKAGVVCECSV